MIDTGWIAAFIATAFALGMIAYAKTRKEPTYIISPHAEAHAGATSNADGGGKTPLIGMIAQGVMLVLFAAVALSVLNGITQAVAQPDSEPVRQPVSVPEQAPVSEPVIAPTAIPTVVPVLTIMPRDVPTVAPVVLPETAQTDWTGVIVIAGVCVVAFEIIAANVIIRYRRAQIQAAEFNRAEREQEPTQRESIAVEYLEKVLAKDGKR
jgi:ascorbate-specific PTS system EIIC-type component UlaA